MMRTTFLLVVLMIAAMILAACPPDDDDDNDDATPTDDDTTDDDDDDTTFDDDTTDDDDSTDDDSIDDDTTDDDTTDDDTADDDSADDDTTDDDTGDDDTIEEMPRRLIFGGMATTADTALFPVDGTPTIALPRADQLWIYSLTAPPTATVLDEFIGSPQSVVDPNGAAHLVYFNDKRHCLVHATHDGDEWARQDLPILQPHTGDQFSAAADSAGRLHLAYLNPAGNQQLYIHDDGTQWLTETIELPDNGQWPDEYAMYVALDGDDEPHFIGLYLYMAIYYCDHSDGEWNWQFITWDGHSLDDFFFRLDADEHAHIAFNAWLEYQPDPYLYLGYATNESGAWDTEVVYANVSEDGYNGAMTLDAAGNPYIVFSQLAPTVNLATRSADGWQITPISESGGGGISLWHDGDALHVAHTYAGSLFHTTTAGGDRQTTEVEKIQGVKVLGDLAKDDDDRLHLTFGAYEDYYHYRLQYGVGRDDDWSFTSFGRSLNDTSYSRLLLDATQAPAILYDENIPPYSYVTLLRQEGASWSTEAIDDGHIDPTTFAADGDGHLHFTLVNGFGLYYGHNRSGEWELVQLVNVYDKAPADPDYVFCSLVNSDSMLVDDDGVVHLTYDCQAFFNEKDYRHHLVYLSNATGIWRQEKILTVENDLTRSSRILRNPAGELEVLFVLDDQLQRARKIDGVWTFETIYYSTYLGAGPLEIPAHYDGQGHLHLLLDTYPGPLYLNDVTGEWAAFEVEPDEPVGYVAEMAVDDAGVATVAYTAADAVWVREYLF